MKYRTIQFICLVKHAITTRNATLYSRDYSTEEWERANDWCNALRKNARQRSDLSKEEIRIINIFSD